MNGNIVHGFLSRFIHFVRIIPFNQITVKSKENIMQYPIPKSAVVFEEEIKKSRFMTYVAHTPGLERAKLFWREIKRLHPDARHHCWACVADTPSDSLALGFSDDGEPAGCAGKPMLNVLLGSGIGEISAVVVRYYGGILLGTGGLVRAYANGVRQALRLVETQLKTQRQGYLLVCDYGLAQRVRLLCEKYDVLIEAQDFRADVRFELGVSGDKLAPFQQELTACSAGALQLRRVE